MDGWMNDLMPHGYAQGVQWFYMRTAALMWRVSALPVFAKWLKDQHVVIVP